MTWKERYKDDDDSFIAVIRWSAEDVRAEMERRFKRGVTDEEFGRVLGSFDAETLKERSIELGWEVLGQLTCDAIKAAGIKED